MHSIIFSCHVTYASNFSRASPYSFPCSPDWIPGARPLPHSHWPKIFVCMCYIPLLLCVITVVKWYASTDFIIRMTWKRHHFAFCIPYCSVVPTRKAGPAFVPPVFVPPTNHRSKLQLTSSTMTCCCALRHQHHRLRNHPNLSCPCHVYYFKAPPFLEMNVEIGM